MTIGLDGSRVLRVVSHTFDQIGTDLFEIRLISARTATKREASMYHLMEIWHRITFGRQDGVDSVIESLAIPHKMSPLPGRGYVIHLDINESDPRWPQLAPLVQQKKPVDMVYTIVTKEEIVKAEWVRLVPTFERGYPQPEDGWERVVYDNECGHCGTGYRQKMVIAPLLPPFLAIP